MRRPPLLGLLLFASCAYFYEVGGWNQNTRFDLVRAIVERGSIRIDDFHENTGDKALSGGHYYADKAPGASWLAAPMVAVARALMQARGYAITDPPALMWLSYVATLAASAAPAAIASLCVFALARRWGASADGAGVAAIAYGLSTPLWAYGTLFFGHALAAACLVGACLAADALRDPDRRPWRATLLGGLVGVLGGWAVLTEYPSVIGAAVFAAVALAHGRRGGSARAARVAIGVCAGAGLCAGALATYQTMAFGSPFHVSYASEENADLLRAGFFGITLPQPRIVGELLWGAQRGLLPLSPALIVAPVGLWLAWRHTDARLTALAGGLVFALYLLLNAAYEHWEGGWAYGPRHLVPALGVLCAGFAMVWDVMPRWGRTILAVVVGFGIGCSLMAVAVTPQPPIGFAHPMRELLWPAFRDGKLAINTQSILDLRVLNGDWAGQKPVGIAWNLGQRLGLPGLWSLLPLMAIWLACAVAWPQARLEPRSARRVTK